MEKDLDYNKIYQIQDRVLKLIFSRQNEFYLTGGTALHRFYYNLRYSDDIDLFSSSDVLFSENISDILNLFDEDKIVFSRTVQTRDFQRIIADQQLQIDFVNDRVYREGKSNVIDGLKIDNITNILTNKISAILNRDEEKDIFDLFAICYNENFNWGKMIEIADKKSGVDRSFLIERLKSFPLDWLSKIKIIKQIEINSEKIMRVCSDILNRADNSFSAGKI